MGHSYKMESELLSEKCVKWEEVEGLINSTLVTVMLDEHKFFLTWKPGTGPSEYLEISSIRDVRLSTYAKIPKDRKVLDICAALIDENDDLSERCMSICSGSDFVNLTWCNLVSKSKEFPKQIFDVIWNEISIPKLRNPSHLSHLKKIWNKLYSEIQDQIEISMLLKHFSHNKDDREKIQDAISTIGIKSKIIKKDEFTFEFFLEMFEKIFLQDLMGDIYDKIGSAEAHSKKQLNNVEFAKFINQIQRDKRLNEILYPLISVDKAKEIILKYESNNELSQHGIISSLGLMKFIFSEDNSIVDLSNYEITQDMNQPLNHYFINSSHNTYLTGHQLTGKSSAEIYRQVLLSGCRCIELDIWDGKGMEDEPIVTHGFTMCTAVPLRDVIDAIDECAFKTSEYPVILSFENHCTSKQLSTLVSIIQEKLSDKILKEPLETNPLDAGVPLPSPEKLKGKILIKNKKKAIPKDMELVNDSSDHGDEDRSVEIIVPQISSMVNYVEPASFESFDKAKSKNVSYECCSLGEIFAIQSLNENPIDFVNFNKRQISRIYPKGTRVDSSNFLPQLFWNAGCQLVALNFQTLDLGMQLNLGLFEYQSRCGYLLKPSEMRFSDRDFDPFLESGVDGVVANSLKLLILSGHFISDKGSYCFVEVEMFGLPADTIRKRYKIKSTTKTGLNPQFPKSVISFNKIIHPKLATLRLIVSTDNTKFVGQCWIPVDQIKPGYKLITLKNESSQSLMMPSLLIFVEIEDYVPCDMEDFALALCNPIAFLSEKERRAQQLEILTEEFLDGVHDNEEETYVETSEKSKSAHVKSNAQENVSVKSSSQELATETLFSKKKQQTLKYKQSYKRKSSLKRGKSTRGTLDNEEILEFLNQNILKDKVLSELDLEKMKMYKGCSKINDKKNNLISAITKKYNKKKVLLLSKGESKDDLYKETKNNKKSIKAKNKSTLVSMDDSYTEDLDSQISKELELKLSQLDSKAKEKLDSINMNQTNELNSINAKYTNLFYEELHSALESDIYRFQQRIEKLYRKETDVLKSLQHYKFKCETKSLQRECSNKDEFHRLKRESLQRHIQSSVAELQMLTDFKNMRLKELEENIVSASDQFKSQKEKDTKQLN